ncbi:MAG: VCBS repeat-containing protein [Chitinophagaceae bacterium]|nr:VCBS repeat-containing protein [Chitinophagaceae bacterium]
MVRTVCTGGMYLCCMVSFNAVSQTAGRDVKFTKHHLWDEFYTEGATVADVNRDGLMDIIAGARWFEAPDWKPHDIWKHKKFDYTKGYSDSFLNFAVDINEDGWTDLVCFDFPGTQVYWFENPQNAGTLWKRYLIDSIASNESPMVVDINGDGKKDLVFGNERSGQMAWYNAILKNGKVSWQRYPVSDVNMKEVGIFSHGLGWGDINGDGINDVIIRSGWWEAPKSMGNAPWKFHKTDLGESCAQMIVYDFDGDGDNDVLTTSAHDYGVWWHEQIRDNGGQISFKKHIIDTTFSESHSVVLQDVNGDGLPDFITGKRFYSHQGKGPGGQEPAVLYWFELLKDGKNKPVWVRHLIDNTSGVGIQFITEDMNKDNKPDIIIANKNGVFYFEQQ